MVWITTKCLQLWSRFKICQLLVRNKSFQCRFCLFWHLTSAFLSIHNSYKPGMQFPLCNCPSVQLSWLQGSLDLSNSAKDFPHVEHFKTSRDEKEHRGKACLSWPHSLRRQWRTQEIFIPMGICPNNRNWLERQISLTSTMAKPQNAYRRYLGKLPYSYWSCVLAISSLIQ